MPARGKATKREREEVEQPKRETSKEKTTPKLKPPTTPRTPFASPDLDNYAKKAAKIPAALLTTLRRSGATVTHSGGFTNIVMDPQSVAFEEFAQWLDKVDASEIEAADPQVTTIPIAGLLPHVALELDTIVRQYAAFRAPDFQNGAIPPLLPVVHGAGLPAHRGANYRNTCGLSHVCTRLQHPGPAFPNIMAIPVGTAYVDVQYTYARNNVCWMRVTRI